MALPPAPAPRRWRPPAPAPRRWWASAPAPRRRWPPAQAADGAWRAPGLVGEDPLTADLQDLARAAASLDLGDSEAGDRLRHRAQAVTSRLAASGRLPASLAVAHDDPLVVVVRAVAAAVRRAAAPPPGA